MKYLVTVFITFVLLGNFIVCDVILYEEIELQKCVKITNLDDYPNIAFIAFKEFVNLDNHDAYIIKSNTCLEKKSSQEKLTIYAVNKDYLKNKDVKKIDWSKEKKCAKSTINIDPIKLTIKSGDPIEGFEEHFNIVGFKDNTIVMYKWKDVKVYGFWRKNQVTQYEFKGDRNGLFQDIK
jgi:hypothetical protein